MDLVKVAWRLTNSSAQAEEQFRRATFNLYAINRDDHSKNHGYVMSEDGMWELSPAYDLTFRPCQAASTGPALQRRREKPGFGKSDGSSPGGIHKQENSSCNNRPGKDISSRV